ncbi:MAG TPA: aminoglycoside phosphotransferase family protein, partial [Actinomycetota bacterium]|nr:aminoglycoside phosphotransferase family protein [Actinomycetota bacterium]
MEPTPEDVERARRALDAAPVSWRPVPAHGAPATRRYVVDLPDGRSAFVKVAAFDYVAGWFRDERRAYEALEGQPFLPRLLGWDDDGEAPLLAIEDLSDARWPPPWDAPAVDAVMRALDALHRAAPRADLPTAEERQFGLDSWPDVQADPEPFLSVGICSRAWLEGNLEALAAASAAAAIEGPDVLHFDVRSDNLCLRDGRVLLVDWNHACVGNALVDTAAWLPSLHAEGGPPPEAILAADTPGLAEVASLLAGYFSARAGLPPIPQAPHARRLQREQAATALPCAA